MPSTCMKITNSMAIKNSYFMIQTFVHYYVVLNVIIVFIPDSLIPFSSPFTSFLVSSSPILTSPSLSISTAITPTNSGKGCVAKFMTSRDYVNLTFLLEVKILPSLLVSYNN